MGRITTSAKWALTAAGSILIVAAQTKPEDAISNIGGWWSFLSGEPVSGVLAYSHIDALLTAVGVALVVSVVWFAVLSKLNPRVIGPMTDTPKEPPRKGWQMRDIVSEGSGCHGVSVESGEAHIDGLVTRDNGGDGLRLGADAKGSARRVHAAGNAGDGVSVGKQPKDQPEKKPSRNIWGGFSFGKGDHLK